MVNTIDIAELMRIIGINHKGVVAVTEEMSGLEQNPKNDWLYFGIRAVQDVANGNERYMAFIGSGNGIDAIAALNKYENLEKVYATDIVPNILEQIEHNIRENTPQAKAQLIFKHGRDCKPLDEEVDLIYLNLPLVAIDAQEINTPLATTTLTDAAAYAHLVRGKDDLLRRYSMLSQLGALLSAKEKLRDGGVIVTMIGGRIPYEVTQKCFQRAGLEHKLVIAGFKRQSDPQYIEQYASLEEKEEVTFAFFFQGS